MNGLHDGLGGMDHQPVVNGFADEEVILQNASRGHFELISLQYVIFLKLSCKPIVWWSHS